jgi:hypothetical protein
MTMHSPRAKPASALQPLARLLLVLQRLNRLHDRWEMRSAAAFLLVACRGEITKPDLERALTMGSGTGYRNIVLMEDALLVRTRKEKGVLVVSLTEYGRGIAGEIEGLLGGQGPPSLMGLPLPGRVKTRQLD